QAAKWLHATLAGSMIATEQFGRGFDNLIFGSPSLMQKRICNRTSAFVRASFHRLTGLAAGHAALILVVLIADVSSARAVDLHAGDILAVDFDFHRVVRIDPITGDRTNVSGSIQNTVGAGPLWNSPDGIVIEPTGSLVVSQRFDTLFRVNPSTGDRVIL